MTQNKFLMRRSLADALCDSGAGTLLALVVPLVMACSCVSRSHERTVIASNEEWTVTALGPVDEPDAEITFEAARRGTPYAAGYLHADSDSFNQEFQDLVWVSPNALRMSPAYVRKGQSFDITLRNEAKVGIRWIRIGSTTAFLVFDVSPQQSSRLPSLWWGGYGYFAEGEFLEGRPIVKGHVMQSEYDKYVEVIVKDADTSVILRRGDVESPALGQSSRRAVIGSMRLARRAGT
jgi:hypothetical protein